LKQLTSYRQRAILTAAVGAFALGTAGLLYAQSTSVDVSKVHVAPETAVDPALGKFMQPGKKKGGLAGSGRILFGTEARPGAYPFQVGVIRDESSLCGGSLIRDNWVLTAAHCVTVIQDGKAAVAAPGSFDIYVGSNQLVKGDRIKVVEVYRHPDYLPAFTDNDVALLKLARAPQGVSYDKIRIVTAANEASLSAPGTRMRIIGWGKTEEGKITTNMRESSVQMVDRATCNNNIVTSRLTVVLGELSRLRLARDKLEEFLDKIGRYAGPLVTDSMICAGVPNPTSDQSLVTDTCNGDSGGPLFTQASDGVWTQVGIVSWGEGCGQPKLHGVYTRLAKFANWVNSTIGR
jgi:secreted trypsin-like serine protease